MGGEGDSFRNDGPFEKCIIFHPTLREKSVGEGLSETLSNDEIAEHILYYYGMDREDGLFRSKEALAFFSLATALRSLPSSLCGTEEPSQLIRLANQTTLVFLEIEVGVIMAILCTKGVDPVVVQDYFQRSHELFRLLRGGGILARLHAGELLGKARTGRYPGMDNIFRLRMHMRRLESSIEDCKADSVMKEIVETKKELEAAYSRMPIALVRNDLSIHYDAFIENASDIHQFFPASFESLLTATTEPLSAANLRRLGSVSCRRKSDICTASSSAMRDVAKKLVETSSVGHLVSVSLFKDGVRLWTESKTNHRCHEKTLQCSHEYMVSFDTNRGSPFAWVQNTRLDTTEKPTRPLPAPLRDLDSSTPLKEIPAVHAGFLPPPPLSMLSSIDSSNSFHGDPSGTSVWAPPVWVETENDTFCALRALVLRDGDHDYLILLEKSPEEDSWTFVDSLVSIKSSLIGQNRDNQDDSDWERVDFDPADALEAKQLTLVFNTSRDVALLFSRGALTGDIFPKGKGKDFPTVSSQCTCNISCLSQAHQLVLKERLHYFREGSPTMDTEECISVFHRAWVYSLRSGHTQLHSVLDFTTYRSIDQVQRSTLWNIAHGDNT